MVCLPCQVLPDAVHRGGNGFKDSFWSNQVVPIRAPLNTLFDVDHLLAWAASVGVVMHRVRASLKLSDSKRDKVTLSRARTSSQEYSCELSRFWLRVCPRWQ